MFSKSMVCVAPLVVLAATLKGAEGAPDDAEKLLRMAEQECVNWSTGKDKDLSQEEISIIKAAAKGREHNSKDKSVRSELIVWLCTDREASKLVDRHGIRISNAKIVGAINLDDAEIPFPLWLDHCTIPERFSVSNAKIPELSLIGSETQGITAVNATIDGDVYLGRNFRAKGTVYLSNATIGGDLDCGGGKFLREKVALDAENVEVRGHVFLRDGFCAKGTVNLLGATIGGNLNCEGGKFVSQNLLALNAQSARIMGSVFLRSLRSKEGKVTLFVADGEVNLNGAIIEGNLECDGGSFRNKGGTALDAGNARVSGNVYLRSLELERLRVPFRSEGEVYLAGAIIDGQLDCSGGHFHNLGTKTAEKIDNEYEERKFALNAQSIRVSGDLFLSDGFTVEGSLDLTGAYIHGYFVLCRVDSPELMMLNLRAAHVGTLRDDRGSWPKNGNLYLHGFTYDLIDELAMLPVGDRIEWLSRQKDHSPQPYQQLASILRTLGHENDARTVLIAGERERKARGALNSRQMVWYYVVGPCIGYGHEPLRALWGLFVVIIGWVLFGFGWSRNQIHPTNSEAYATIDTDCKRQLAQHYPRFNALVYSLDVFVPLIKLHQVDYWLPTGPWLRTWFWFQIIAGWTVTTLLVVGFTRLVQSD